MHIASGDVWAGAEVAIARLVPALNCHYDVSAIVFNEGKLAHVLRDGGVKVHVIQEKGSFRDMPMSAKIGRILKRDRVDLVHAHGYKETVLGVVSGRLAGVRRFVCTHHGGPEPFTGLAEFKNQIYLLLDHVVTKHGIDEIISVSEDLRSRLVHKYGSEKVITIHNGIALENRATIDKTKTRREFGFPVEVHIVGTVGRLTPVKGLHHFLKAARIVLEARRDVLFLIVGDGPLRDGLEEMARQFGIHDSVIFLGFREDAVELMSVMDIFALTSLHEGIPMALLEAMSLGLGVVATRVGGIPEVIEDGRSGVLVSPADERSIALGILELISLGPETLGAAARRRVHEKFSLQTMVSNTVGVYRQLLT